MEDLENEKDLVNDIKAILEITYHEEFSSFKPKEVMEALKVHAIQELNNNVVNLIYRIDKLQESADQHNDTLNYIAKAIEEK